MQPQDPGIITGKAVGFNMKAMKGFSWRIGEAFEVPLGTTPGDVPEGSWGEMYASLVGQNM